MKFNMMIGGVETIFPDVDVRYFENKKRVIVYFLKINNKDTEKIKKYIIKPIMKFEDNFLVLLLKDFQYALNLDGYEELISLYENGVGVGFAFENEDGKLLDISVPTFYK